VILSHPAIQAPREAPLDGLYPFLPQSLSRPLEPLIASIEAVGLARPLIIFHDGPEQRLAAGARRLAALRALGCSSAPVVDLGPLSLGRAAALALADNQERGWNEAETALIWRFLAEHLTPEESSALAACLELGGSSKIRQWRRRAAELPPEALEELARGRLDLETAARIAAWPEKERAALLDLFYRLEPSKQKKKQWLDWLEDVARRENLPPSRLLALPSFAAVLRPAAEKKRADAEEAARELLWRRRHPRLAKLTDRRRRQIRELALPRAMRLETDWSFEDVSYGLRLTFSTYEEFARLAARVAELPDKAAMRGLFLDDDLDDGDDQ
jgi:ParB-like chromosome segregation protein Spo0J